MKMTGTPTAAGEAVRQRRSNRVHARGLRRRGGQHPTERDCCLEAMKYEGMPLSDRREAGAIRFGIFSGRCLIDREQMMGQPRHERRPLGAHRHTCGPARTCTGATRRARRTRPTSRRADSARWRGGHPPNGPAARGNSQGYRTPLQQQDAVGCASPCERRAEACCDVPLARVDRRHGRRGPGEPCLAWQIVDGKCRKQWFEDGLGRHRRARWR